MTKDFSELVEYLDKKFTGINGELVEIRSDVGRIKGDMGQMQSDLGQVQSDLSELRERVDATYTGLDAYAKKADTYFQEMLMLANKVDRHERWFHQLAEKLGVKLEY